MRKKYTYLIPVFILFLSVMTVWLATETYAVPADYRVVTKTKKIKVAQKSYLKVTSDRGVNHTLYYGKPGNTKNYQAKYGTEVYFAVTRGTYYLESSSKTKFTVKCARKRVPGNYRKNISFERAEDLKKGKKKIALSFSTDKKKNCYRYYKLTPDRDGCIIYTGGILYDSEKKPVSGITASVYPIIYADDGGKTPKKVTWYEGFPGVFPYLRTRTINPLVGGQTYYLKVDLSPGQNTIMGQNAKKKKSADSAVPVIWEYAQEDPMAD